MKRKENYEYDIIVFFFLSVLVNNSVPYMFLFLLGPTNAFIHYTWKIFSPWIKEMVTLLLLLLCISLSSCRLLLRGVGFSISLLFFPRIFFFSYIFGQGVLFPL